MNPLKKFQLPHEQGKFGAIRKHDIHTGIDLYCDLHEPVYAIESGQVTKVEPFTGRSTDSPWWRDTHCVVVRGRSGYILYGEIAPCVFIGDFVKEGQELGKVLRVCWKDKGLPTTMLHLELYDRDREPATWKLDEEIPDGLLDPTCLIK